MDKLTHKKGQSLFEVIVATGVVAITLVALVGLISASVGNTSFSRDRTLATRYTTEALEWIRGQRDQDWNMLISKGDADGNMYCIGTLTDLTGLSSTTTNVFSCSIPSSNFYRAIIIKYNSLDPSNVEVEVTTQWRDSGGLHESRSSTILTNWQSQ